MTDPVDTNKLRELQALCGGILSRNLLEGSGVWKINREITRALARAADEVDRLRAALKDADDRLALGVLVNLDGEQFVDHPVMQMLAEKNERLRAVIENAPHREHCRPNIACICWKADVL